jgi:hypothetical protein
VTLVNLNQARKAKAKRDAKALAAENRVKFGRTKTQKAAAQAEADSFARAVEGNKREP